VQAEEWFNRGDLLRVVEDKVQTVVTAEKAEAFYTRAFTGKPLDPDILEQRATPIPNQRVQITELIFICVQYNVTIHKPKLL
jgi:transcriptional regulator of met regulon